MVELSSPGEKTGGCAASLGSSARRLGLQLHYDLELAIERRAAGLVELVAFGRPFIANPDLVERFKQDKPLAESTRDDYCGGDAKGDTDWVKATA